MLVDIDHREDKVLTFVGVLLVVDADEWDYLYGLGIPPFVSVELAL